MKAVLLLLLVLALPAGASNGNQVCESRMVPADATNVEGLMQACLEWAPEASGLGAWTLTATVQSPQLLGSPPMAPLQVVADGSGCSVVETASLATDATQAIGGMLTKSWRVSMTGECDVRATAWINNTAPLFVAMLPAHLVPPSIVWDQWVPAVVLGFIMALATVRLIKSGLLLYIIIVVASFLGLSGLFLPEFSKWIYVGAIILDTFGLWMILFAYRFGLRPETLFPDPSKPRL